MTEDEEIVKCTECNSRSIVLDSYRGERYCKDCGLVVEEDMLEDTMSPKEKPGDPYSERIREVAKEAFPLGSFVGSFKSDGSFDRSKIGYKLRRLQNRSLPSHVRSLHKGIAQARMLAAEMGASDRIKEQIAWTYKKLAKDRVFTGTALDIRAATIVYFVYKDNGINVKIEEVCIVNGAHPRQVAKMARKIARYFKKPWVLSQRNIVNDIEKYCTMLGSDRILTRDAIRLSAPLEEIGNHMCLTMNVGWTSAIIYLCVRAGETQSYRTQKDITEACGITEVTLRNNYKAILELLGLTREDVEKLTVDEIVEGAINYGKRE
jgi:transcription initiation factor TFIIB